MTVQRCVDKVKVSVLGLAHRKCPSLAVHLLLQFSGFFNVHRALETVVENRNTSLSVSDDQMENSLSKRS